MPDDFWCVFGRVRDLTLQFRGLYQKVVHKRPVQEDCVVISLFPVLFSYLFWGHPPPLRLKGWERDHSFRETTQGSLGRILCVTPQC